MKRFDLVKLINIENYVKCMDEVNLSQFTKNIKYVPLENKENIFFNYINYWDILGNSILVSDMNICVLYDMSGLFISRIGNQGRGPGEYDYATNFQLGNNGKIYLQNNYDLLVYDLNGKFITKYKRIFLPRDNYYLSRWLQINDSLYFGHVSNSTGIIENKALIVDKFGEIRHSWRIRRILTP